MVHSSHGEQWISLRRARARQSLVDIALVLTAVDIEHRLDFDGHEWCLWVPVDSAAAAAAELESYQRENRPAPGPVAPAPAIDSGWLGVMGYLLVIWALPWLEASAVFEWRWREIGWMEAGLVRDGAWWRTATALTLHADLGHIVANSLFGAVFGLLAGRLLGSGVGWLLILLAGMIGNTLNAWIQPDQFRSLGASTATFAALAMVGAVTWRRGYYRGRGWRRSLAPVFGGIAMLVYTGLGGENTDVIAHLTGFCAGFALGMLAAAWPVARGGVRLQWWAGCAAAGLLLSAWYSAGMA